MVEVNSIPFHSLPSDQRADEERYAAMNDAGFTVAVVWEVPLWSHPQNVAATLIEGRRRARLGEAVVVHSDGCPWPAEYRGTSDV